MEPQEIEKLYRAYPRQVYSLLDTSSHGLTAAEVEERRKKYGPNKLAKAKKKPLWKTFVENFISPMALLLWAAGIISLVASFLGKGTSESLGPVTDPQMMYLAIAIWLVNIINGFFSFLQQFKAGHYRHLYIGNDKIHLSLFQKIQRFLSIRCLAHDLTVLIPLLEHRLQSLNNKWFVIHQ